MKEKIFPIIISSLFALLLWYFMLPPLNPTSPTFWVYLFTVAIFVLIVFFLTGLNQAITLRRIHSSNIPKWFSITIASGGVILLVIIIINICVSPIFNASKYATRIYVDETSSFTDDVAPVDFSKIPLLDKESSQKLGDRVMGQATEWVSQFYVSDLYTQINYNDQIIRVTPIEYDGIIKYFTNRSEGIKGYITVDSTNGEAQLVTLEEGMHYMPSAYFFENLYRKLRISYPTTIFAEASFEIDNEGHPYWIVPTIKYKGIGMREEISGVVILDAVTGKSKKYSIGEIPSWVDHAYPSSLIIDQLDNWGEYKEGFINSIFGQKNVTVTTEGYNYLVMNDDVYLYTGITSVSNDESILGFVMVNLRTKETHYYSAPGAKEYSAMASAEGLVQDKEYEASFPLLVNLNNKPTYLMSLKDNAGLVKMYAFVDVEDYQKVVVSDSALGIEAAADAYLNEVGSEYDASNLVDATITISDITSAVIDGFTYYYITDSENKRYMTSIKNGQNILPFLNNGDVVDITYSEGNINQIATISLNEE